MKFEFQVSNKLFFSISVSHALLGTLRACSLFVCSPHRTDGRPGFFSPLWSLCAQVPVYSQVLLPIASPLGFVFLLLIAPKLPVGLPAVGGAPASIWPSLGLHLRPNSWCTWETVLRQKKPRLRVDPQPWSLSL